MTATFIYMMVFLKLPIAALLWLVWWAVKQTPESEPGAGGDGGQRSRPHPHPRSPRSPRPRRGPHGSPPLASPPRVRPLAARGRRLGAYR